MIDRSYSQSTIDSYLQALRRFLQFLKPKTVSEIDENDMVNYVHNYILPIGYSFTFQNHTVNAVKLFFTHVLKTDFRTEKLERTRPQKLLPNVLSKDEVQQV